MLINQLKKAKILSETPLEAVNKQIEIIQLRVERKIKEVDDFAKSRGIAVTINGRYEIASTINSQLGVWLEPSYSKYFDAYTAKIDQKFLLWYAVRDGIYNFHQIVNSQVQKNKIKTMYEFDKKDLIKKYKNGKKEYKKTDEIVKIIELAQQIQDNFTK